MVRSARGDSCLLTDPLTTKAPHTRGFRECAEEDANLHTVIPDQVLNLVGVAADVAGEAGLSRGAGNALYGADRANAETSHLLMASCEGLAEDASAHRTASPRCVIGFASCSSARPC